MLHNKYDNRIYSIFVGSLSKRKGTLPHSSCEYSGPLLPMSPDIRSKCSGLRFQSLRDCANSLTPELGILEGVSKKGDWVLEKMDCGLWPSSIFSRLFWSWVNTPELSEPLPGMVGTNHPDRAVSLTGIFIPQVIFKAPRFIGPDVSLESS